MARTLAELPKGARITADISLGVLARMLPRDRLPAAFAATERASRRQRELPAHVVVYDIIALALYRQVSSREVLRCVLEGLQWIAGPTQVVRVTGNSGISQARTRLGWRPLQQLHDELVRPIAGKATDGARYREWRLLSLDGSTLDVADTAGNRQGFGRPGADLLRRIKTNTRVPFFERWPDGSYRSVLYPPARDRRHGTHGVGVRAIEYPLAGVAEAEDLYRLVTTLVDPDAAPASELAALQHERWGIETALDAFKTHLRGAKIVLRSQTPDLVRQEFYGVLLAHFAIRGLMHEAALTVDLDPDRWSDVHAVRVIRRKPPLAIAIPPSGTSGLP